MMPDESVRYLMVAHGLRVRRSVSLSLPCPCPLQQLLAVCQEYAEQHDILYNTTKTECMIIPPKHSRVNYHASGRCVYVCVSVFCLSFLSFLFFHLLLFPSPFSLFPFLLFLLFIFLCVCVCVCVLFFILFYFI